MNLELLQKFCSKDGTRYHLEKPWSRGEHTFATNGHIGIRVPRIAEIEENPEAPEMRGMFAEAVARAGYQWIEPPEVKLISIKCGLCDGSGTCDVVAGEKFPCEDCDGTGDQWEHEAIRFPINGKEIGLANIYIALIRELPKPELGLIEDAAVTWVSCGKNKPSGTPVMFRFDGGMGLLMPVRL